MGEPFIFIDATFFCFYRYGATKTWYSNHTKQGEADDCHVEHEGFLNFYKNQFNSALEKICKKFKSQNVYWFADTPRSKLWRMPHHDEYKSNRDDRQNDEIGPMISWTYENLIPANRVIRVNTAEADDCLAVAAHYERKQNPTQKIYVITGDSDYLQLVDDHLVVINPKGNATLSPFPIEIKIGKVRQKIEAEHYLLTKILMGDKSDVIPAVFSGCGPSTAYQLAKDSARLHKEVISVPERNEIFQRNKLLISFQEIPEHLRTEIVATYIKLRVPPKENPFTKGTKGTTGTRKTTKKTAIIGEPKRLIKPVKETDKETTEPIDMSSITITKPTPPKLNLLRKKIDLS